MWRSLLPPEYAVPVFSSSRICSSKARLNTARYSTRTERRGLLTESYAKGPTSPPLLQHTIPQHFAGIVKAHGDRTAVISRSQSERLSYRELDERSNILARGLRERGVGRGDRIAVQLGNCWEFAVGTYAISKLGAILVPLNPAFNSTQVIAALSHLEAAHLIISAETNLPFKKSRENISLIEAIAPDLGNKILVSPTVPSLRNIFLVDNSSSQRSTSALVATTPFVDLFSSPSAAQQDFIPDTPLHKDEISTIQFTSGTTSTPKAACLTHHSTLNNGHLIGARMGLTPSDIVCCPPPLFHCFGCILGYMATATHGSAILFPSESFNPMATLLSIQEERATALYGVATMFVAELELLSSGTVKNEGFEGLRTGIAAGSSVPRALMEKLHKQMNLTGLTICYGMTETSPVSLMTTPDDPMEKRVDSVGKLLPWTEAKIVSVSDRSQILPLGEKGELVVSGYLVMKEYWDDKARTEEARVVERDGEGKEKVWMYTGDEAEMDEDGYVKITGRIKDLIIRGGENIHPLEVENVLFQMEQVSEISVVGVPDERYGEVVAAFVVVHRSIKVGIDDKGDGVQNLEAGLKVFRKEDVREWVRANLSSHLVPKYVFWVDQYPKTASGKIQKFKLREMAMEWLKGTLVEHRN